MISTSDTTNKPTLLIWRPSTNRLQQQNDWQTKSAAKRLQTGLWKHWQKTEAKQQRQSQRTCNGLCSPSGYKNRALSCIRHDTPIFYFSPAMIHRGYILLFVALNRLAMQEEKAEGTRLRHLPCEPLFPACLRQLEDKFLIHCRP